jgi:YggT family protein
MVIREVLCLLLQLYFLVLIVRIILSYVTRLPEPVQPLARGVRALTDPVLEPLRRVIPPVRFGPGALDLSPIVLFFGITILRSLLGCGRGLF